MKFRVVFLASAEEDLKDLKAHIVKKFGAKAWLISHGAIKDSVRALQSFPLAGGIADEIRNLYLTQFRQVISWRNRIIYEIRPNAPTFERRTHRIGKCCPRRAREGRF